MCLFCVWVRIYVKCRGEVTAWSDKQASKGWSGLWVGSDCVGDSDVCLHLTPALESVCVLLTIPGLPGLPRVTRRRKTNRERCLKQCHIHSDTCCVCHLPVSPACVLSPLGSTCPCLHTLVLTQPFTCTTNNTP